MADFLEFKADWQNLYAALRRAAPEVALEVRKDMTAAVREVAAEARTHVPSGMQKGRAGVGWGFMGSKGVYVHAGGRSAPKSWVGSYVGGSGHASTFKHPVYPSTKGQGDNSDRKKWVWVSQPTHDFLTETWNKRATWLILKVEEAVQRGLERAVGNA